MRPGPGHSAEPCGNLDILHIHRIWTGIQEKRKLRVKIYLWQWVPASEATAGQGSGALVVSH